VRRALTTDVKQIKTAGISPQEGHIALFAAQFPPTEPFSRILQRLEDYVRTSDLFHPCSMRENIEAAELFDDVKGLTVKDRMTFIKAPIGRDPKTRSAVKKMAQCVAENLDGSILRIEGIDLEALDMTPRNIIDLQRLEALHKSLIVYLWLSYVPSPSPSPSKTLAKKKTQNRYRFPATFTPRETAQELKLLCEKQIEIGLQAVRFTRKKLTRGRRMANMVAESLDPDAMANLEAEEEKTEPETQHHHQHKHQVIVEEQQHVGVEETDFYGSNYSLCLNCGLKGHSATNCPEPAKAEGFSGKEDSSSSAAAEGRL
jgi:ATP-dependent RNA helicase SUPV3L1/SUV3